MSGEGKTPSFALPHMSGGAPSQIDVGPWTCSMPAHRDAPSAPSASRASPPAAPLYRALEDKPGRKKRQRLDLLGPAPAFAVNDALQEITSTPAVALHRNAAHAWAARAVACYRVCLGKVDLQEGLSYLYLGEHYRETALAHAGFGEAWHPLSSEVDAVMSADRNEASDAMRRRSLANPAATA